MNHKRSESGFSLHLILTILLVVLAIGLSGWYVVNRHKIAQNNSNYVTGYISVIFKDGVTFQQAQDLATSLNLGEITPDAGDTTFTPILYRVIKSDQFDKIQAKIKTYPEVVKFIDNSADPSNNVAGPGEKMVKVTFKQDVTCDKIKSISIDSGLGTPNQPCSTSTRFVSIKVPDGKENSFVRRFKSSPLVETADRVSNQVLPL